MAGESRVAPVFSLAGRTADPVLPPVPVRIGGFGGPEGLGHYLRENRVAAVVDATHPFAAQMSRHAAEACAQVGVPLAGFSRPPWQADPADRWTTVADLPAAALALGNAPLRVFLTTGRLGLPAFRAAPQHHYLIRTIDPPDPDACPPRATRLLDRGPFTAAADAALMTRERIDVLVTKDSGGAAGAGKLAAARMLKLPVIMVARPPRPGLVFTHLADVLAWIEAAHAPSP